MNNNNYQTNNSQTPITIPLNSTKKNKKYQKLIDTLDKLEIDAGFDINDFLIDHWEDVSIKQKGLNSYNDSYFQRRSFDVILCNQKKKLLPKEFKCIKGCVTRIK